jgi:hypothetical protein
VPHALGTSGYIHNATCQDDRPAPTRLNPPSNGANWLRVCDMTGSSVVYSSIDRPTDYREAIGSKQFPFFSRDRRE